MLCMTIISIFLRRVRIVRYFVFYIHFQAPFRQVCFMSIAFLPFIFLCQFTCCMYYSFLQYSEFVVKFKCKTKVLKIVPKFKPSRSCFRLKLYKVTPSYTKLHQVTADGKLREFFTFQFCLRSSL